MSLFKVWTLKFSQTKFSGDNLAEDLMKREIWRKTFKFFPIMELVKLREVCLTFKEEVDFLFATQTKLGLFGSGEPLFETELCQDPLHDVPNSSWIRMETSFIEHLSTLKSLFPSVKVLCIHYQIECEIEKVLGAFVGLECLTISGYICLYETTPKCFIFCKKPKKKMFPNLKHLITTGSIGGQMLCLPSLESLEIKKCFDTIEQWLELNVGLPSKRFEICFYSELVYHDFSFQCLSSLPSSLEYLKTGHFLGYSRRFQPLFPKLKEVERRKIFLFGANHVTPFINFLKDHRLTLKKVSTNLNDVNVEQLEEILSVLSCGTHVTLHVWYFLKEADYVQRFMAIGRQCREKNHVLNLVVDMTRDFCMTLDEMHRFVQLLPPETQSLQFQGVRLHWLIPADEASCRRYIQAIHVSSLRLVTLKMKKTTEEIRRVWTSAIQGLPETHEAILEFFEPKPQRVIIRRRNWQLHQDCLRCFSASVLLSIFYWDFKDVAKDFVVVCLKKLNSITFPMHVNELINNFALFFRLLTQQTPDVSCLSWLCVCPAMRSSDDHVLVITSDLHYICHWFTANGTETKKTPNPSNFLQKLEDIHQQ